MSLPPLLLERLKRRRIIQQAPPSVAEKRPKLDTSLESKYQPTSSVSKTKPIEVNFEGQEEIFAEDHSDEEQSTSADASHQPEPPQCPDRVDNFVNSEPAPVKDSSRCDEDQINTHPIPPGTSVLGCPNKYNIYHNCNQFCIDNYSEPEQLTPSPEQERQLALVLKAFPIGHDWKVVFDPGVKTFYFWNLQSNLVSWYPPSLDGYISAPADEIRRSMQDTKEYN